MKFDGLCKSVVAVVYCIDVDFHIYSILREWLLWLPHVYI